MSLENNRNNRERMHPAKAALLAGAVVAAAAGAKSGYEKERANSHVLSPASISELKTQSNATDEEISVLEMRLKQLMLNELRRIREGR